MTSREFSDRLERRAKRAGVSVSPPLRASLEAYFRLLSAWNKKINLCGMDLASPTSEAFDRLLVEPLAAATHCTTRSPRLLDIGSGGGSPAIPMALTFRRCRLQLVESKVRKSVFLREAVREAGLLNANVRNARFETLLTKPDLHETQDLVTLRAVRLDSKTLHTIQAFMRSGGQLFWFCASGASSPQTLPPSLAVVARHSLVKSLRSELVVLEKTAT